MNVAHQAFGSSPEIPLSMQGPAPTSVVVGFGFWLFLLSDIIIFAALFAAYAVLSGETAGGPNGNELFDKGHVLLETACLLASSFTCGLGSLAVQRRDMQWTFVSMAATFILGAAFLIFEASEFSAMLTAGAGPPPSALASGVFSTVR